MSTAKFDTLSTLDGSRTIPVSTVAQGTARAWVNFNGTGTVAIRASFNVSSITDNGTGNYIVNFTTALPDSNYAVCGSTDYEGVTVNQAISLQSNSNQTTTCQLLSVAYDGSPFDNSCIAISIFR
jgi:hypothetical protein